MSTARFKAFHYANHDIPLAMRTRYPLHKFRMLRDAAASIPQLEVISGSCAQRSEIELAHSTEYYEAVMNETLERTQQREMGFPVSKQLFERASHIVGSTLDASRSALHAGLSFVLGGGAHHSFRDRGRGYCVFNDVAVAALWLLENNLASRISVVDLDVHQGDGTAQILSNVEGVFTFSIHGIGNYPFRKENSTLDVALPDNSEDEIYLQYLKEGLYQAIDCHQADFVFYIAGADAFEDDKLGRLNISSSGLRERDSMLAQKCFHGEIPLCIVLGGGYCEPIEKTVELNIQTLKCSLGVFS